MRKTLRQRIFGPHALSFPTWAYLVFFYLIPVALVVWYSFGYKPDAFTTYATDVLSLGRYKEALNGSFLKTFWATLRIAVVGTMICLVISVPFAYWLAVKVRPGRRGVLLALVLIPFWTNFLVRTIGWQVMLSPSGFVAQAIKHLGLGGPFHILYTRTAVQVGVVYNYLPLMILPLFVAIDRAGQDLREASRDLGAGRLGTFVQVTLPMAAPGIASGCLLTFIPLMGDYVTATVLGGAKGTMVGTMIASQFNEASNWALGSAMAVTLIVFIFGVLAAVGIITVVIRLLVKRMRRVDVDTHGTTVPATDTLQTSKQEIKELA